MFNCKECLSNGGGVQAVWPSGSSLQITTEVTLSKPSPTAGSPQFQCALE